MYNRLADNCTNSVSENRDLNTYEIYNRKTILNSKPLKLGIVLTNWCNLHCIMCPSDRNNGSSVFPAAALSKIEQLLPYVERIDWQGGEFFGFRHIKEMFLRFKIYPHIRHVITTNGLLLDEEWIKLLMDLDANLVFSIDSPIKEAYEYIRKGADYGSLIEKLELIKECERRFNRSLKKEITVVVMKSNYRHLIDFIPFIEKYGFSSVNFNPVMFLENQENIFRDIEEETINYFNQTKSYIKKALAKSGIGCGWNLPESLSFKRAALYCGLPLDAVICFIKNLVRKYKTNPLKQKYKESGVSFPKKDALYCVMPWQMMWVSIERNGDIFPDCWCIHPIGNIFRDNLWEVWNNEKMQEYRRNIIAKNTGLCNKDCLSGYTAVLNAQR